MKKPKIGVEKRGNFQEGPARVRERCDHFNTEYTDLRQMIAD